MGESEAAEDASTKFRIDVPDGDPLTRNATVMHRDHGPMHVDEIRVGSSYKRVTLTADMGPEALQMTGEDLCEEWGETIHADPAELDDGKTRYTKEFSSTDDEIEVTIEAAGPEDRTDPVMAHLHDQVVRALRAVENHEPPAECDGVYEIDWETIFGKLEEGKLEDYEDGDA
jgi:hypothetical protein